MDMSKLKDLLEKLEAEENKTNLTESKTSEAEKATPSNQEEKKSINEESTPSQSTENDQRHTINSSTSNNSSDSYDFVNFILSLRNAFKKLPYAKVPSTFNLTEAVNRVLRREGYAVIRLDEIADRTIYQLPNLGVYVEYDNGEKYINGMPYVLDEGGEENERLNCKTSF